MRLISGLFTEACVKLRSCGEKTSTLKMEAQDYSETSALVYPSTRLQIPEQCNDDNDDFTLLQYGFFTHCTKDYLFTYLLIDSLTH